MRVLLVVAALALAEPVHAQQPAISPELSPDAAAASFVDAVMSVCLPAVSGGARVAASAKVQPATDPETRRRIGAASEDTVWDVVSGKGVVAVAERAGRCSVSVYGPRAQPVMGVAADRLAGAGFQKLGKPAVGLRQSLMRQGAGGQVHAEITGSEPGMPGHQSRFPVITATLFTP